MNNPSLLEFAAALAFARRLGKRVVNPYLAAAMNDDRPLTAGEISIARTMFGDAIDYRRVRMMRRKWWPFQPRGVVMAPTGNIHFRPDDPNWRDDYSTASLSLQGLFIHEMTHVWQSQKHGRFYLPLMRHPFCRYDYVLMAGQPFERYGLEQQAELVRHRFLADHGGFPSQACDRDLLPFKQPAN